MISSIMTLDEAARFLKVASVTLYRKARRGEVPAAKLGRSWRFHREQLEEWIKNSPRLPNRSSQLPPSSFRHLSTRETESVLDFVESLRKDERIKKIILYGSRARGDFLENSDIDLLVVTNPDNSLLKKSILEKARHHSLIKEILLQVLILSQEEWQNPSFKTFLIVEKIKREGIPLYE